MTSREFQRGDVRLMVELIAELWPGGRHSVGYAFMAQRLPYDDWAARLWFDGDMFVGWGWSVGWREPIGLSYEVRPGYERLIDEMLDWSGAASITVRGGDDTVRELVEARGFAFQPDEPWLRWNARALDVVEAPVVPAGYRLATMAEYASFESRSAAHRSAFGFPDRPSRFTDEVYETIRGETPWRADLDCVLVDPDGEVVAYTLAWLDERNRVGELEPVGVRREHHRKGFGRAVCLFALERMRAAGAETALVGSRGDDGYPAPRALYESIGFQEAWRQLPFTRAS